MQWLVNFFSQFFDTLYGWFQTVLYVVVDAFVIIFKLVLDGALTAIYGIIQVLDLGSMAVNAASYWGMIDGNIAYLVVQTGIPSGLSMLAGAYTIRILLNIIPAALTRL